MSYFIKPLKVFYLLVVTLLLLLWLEQGSINAYWMQTYHRNSPLMALESLFFWQKGAQISHKIEQQFDAAKNQLDQFNEYSVELINNTLAQLKNGQITESKNQELNENSILTFHLQRIFLKQTHNHQMPFMRFVTTPSFSREMLITASSEEQTKQAINALEQQLPDHLFKLEKGQKVFFVGDSLMQGVAPHVMRMLRKEYKIESINLSKQSTGLAYPHIFDWPKLADTTFEAHPDIKLMIVFMGPNDPWPFPVIRGYPHIKFNSPEWEGVYRTRIQKLINTAAKRNARVLWIGAPNVKDPKLNAGIIRLNRIYQSQVTIAKQQYLPSNDILGMPDHNFVKFIQIPNKGNVALRTNDGIHFTTIGQKRIADKIFSLLHFKDSQEEPKTND